MSALSYPYGFNYALTDWQTGSFQWVLATSTAVTSPTSSIFVADVLAGGAEITATGYTRQAVTSPTSGASMSPAFVYRDCDPPDFGVLSGGDVAAWLILAAVITDDTDSWVVAAFPIAYTADGATAAAFQLPTSGPVVVAFSCPSDVT